MRIIGGNDYYDGVVPYDTDNTRIYQRTHYTKDTKDLIELPVLGNVSYRLRLGNWKDKHRDHDGYTWYLGKQTRTDIDLIHVIFCGRKYSGIVETLVSTDINDYKVIHKNYYWTFEKFDEFVKANNIKYGDANSWDMNVQINKNTIEDYFKVKVLSGSDLQYLIDNRILIAIGSGETYHKVKWKINPDELKDIGFPAVFDAWSAYQELDMFIGSVLVSDQDKMVRVSDESKAKKYGFDKWSFKNQKHRAKPRGK